MTRGLIEMTECQQIIDTFLDVVKTKYADDVDIIIRYRAWFSTPAQDKSHINLFVVARSERAAGLGLMHIVDGYTVKVMNIKWEDVEGFYATHHIEASMLRTSQLVYYASEDNRRRYEELKKRIAESKAKSQITIEAVTAAIKHLKHAKQCFADFCINDDLLDAARILSTICDCICKLNNAHPRFGVSGILEEMQGFTHLPDELQLFYKFDASRMDGFIEHAEKSKQAFLALLDEHNVSIAQLNSPDEMRRVLE
jgi:hypothetical protein